MHRQPPVLVWLTAVLILLSGCRPQQPFYLFEDGDLSHYKGVATEMEHPDVAVPSLGDAEGANRPFSLLNKDAKEIWDLTLEEAVKIALANSKIARLTGGRDAAGAPPDYILRMGHSGFVGNTYDVALAESHPLSGVEAALAAFDAQFSALTQWRRTDEPQNRVSMFIFPDVSQSDVGTFQAQLRKFNATGGQMALTHEWVYSYNNIPSGFKYYPSDWSTRLRAEIRQPLLQGYGVQFNRIAGPGATPGAPHGVMIARINTDLALCDFESTVNNIVSDVENAYWDLYYYYGLVATTTDGRDSALRAWREIYEKFQQGAASVQEEAQSRALYYEFRQHLETALLALFRAESTLRYVMGIAANDGRLIRPATEATTAKVTFDWNDVLAEALARNVWLRSFRWKVKGKELELIAAKNYLLPKLDLVAQYQWQGLGHYLIESPGRSSNFRDPASNAYQVMTGGDFQNWGLGMEFSMPLGFRREMAGVRYAQLALSKERARLQEAELELTHQLGWAVRDVESLYANMETKYNRRIAARDEVRAGEEKRRLGAKGGEYSLLLDAYRRQAAADQEYYASVRDYNKAITNVHYRKGSLLEYNGVYLAEGPWPAKAYFDAHRRARARDASLYLDYGFTMPKVVSRGPVEQQAGGGGDYVEGFGEASPPPASTEVPAPGPKQGRPEEIPPPPPEPLAPGQALPLPAPPNEPESRARGRGGWTRPTATNGNANVQAGAIARTAPGSSYDIGAFDLRKLASAADAQPAAGNSGHVQQASFLEPVKSSTARGEVSGRDQPASRPRPVPAVGGLKWGDSTSPPNTHEPETHPTSAGADRPASGWKRVQR